MQNEAQKEVQAELMRQKGFPQKHPALEGGEISSVGGDRVPSEQEVRQRLAKRGYTASDADVRVVLEGETEMAHRRGWNRCYPCKNMGRYSPLVERYRHNMDLMLKWVTCDMV